MLFSVSACFAQSVPLYNINPATDGTFVEPADNATWGWSFYVKSPITVTHLAWNDTNGDGLSHSHQVGIWKDTSGKTEAQWPFVPFPDAGTLVRSTTIPSGTSAELVGPWRRMPITPVTLAVGAYSIGGQNSAQSQDNMMYRFIGGTTGMTPLIDFRALAGSFTLGGQPGFYSPGSANSSGWYLAFGVELGAMMFVEPVPEPGSPMLTTLASAWVSAFWFRRVRH
jgi:hypothetical protein